MNKTVALILLLLYSTFTTGMVLDIHYCMGKIASVQFEKLSTDGHCNTCGAKAGMDCCKDEFKILKVNDTHNAVANNINLQSPGFQMPSVRYVDFSATLQNVSADIISTTHSPPLDKAPDIYIRNCIFRI